MNLHETPAQQALRTELRSYFAGLLPPDELRAVAEQGAGGPRFREVVRMLGRDGWLGVGWPTEYGGRGLGPEEQFIFYDEVQRAGVPFPLVTVNTVGPTLMEFGTDEQKATYLPSILRGETVFAIGYTEPGAGTDLASLTTRAVRDEATGDFVVDGSKIFTTGGNTADHVWLACRTDPDAPKHQGISILVVPCDDPGFSWSPIRAVGGMSVTATYYSGIRVPAANLVGGLHEGWRLITAQLNHERVALAALGGRMIQLWEQVVAWARETGATELPWVRSELARAHARLEAMRLMNGKLTAEVAGGALSGTTAGAAKTYGTETHVEVQRILAHVLGAGGRIRPGSPAAVLHGQVEQISRQGIVNTFGGGVNEVLRDMIATQGLGLPRSRR
ncbi:acyl-CoA dehydrogenase family protein [Nocardioides sp. SOB77]|uniref:Acyl-CoA dehydrogenase family protein n=1 Tax=Nocardioides oceani TaxID=3058369 RepID=A0ABT8FBU3_9ACTN|nr:acyl-CoA dehydrogenase family protein [Nocardioides oceani]MDN4172153.1 acyl-CoA dehydrogenase family protein [Nocardioides oceani]